MVISVGRAAAIAGIVIVALMIAGTIPVTVDDAWLWGLLSLFSFGLFVNRGRGRRRPWEQRWWWERADVEVSGCCTDAPPPSPSSPPAPTPPPATPE